MYYSPLGRAANLYEDNQFSLEPGHRQCLPICVNVSIMQGTAAALALLLGCGDIFGQSLNIFSSHSNIFMLDILWSH